MKKLYLYITITFTSITCKASTSHIFFTAVKNDTIEKTEEAYKENLQRIAKQKNSEYLSWTEENFFKKTDDRGNTPLHIAVSAKSWKVLPWLIQQKAGKIKKMFNHANKAGDTPMDISIKAGNLAMVTYLCTWGDGADNTWGKDLWKNKNKVRDTAIHTSYKENQQDIIKHLIKKYGKDVLYISSEKKCNIIGSIVWQGNFDLLKYIHQNHQEILTPVRCKALCRVIEEGHKAMALYLLEAYPDILGKIKRKNLSKAIVKGPQDMVIDLFQN